MTANGVAYELPTWARRTDDSACSSLPAAANTPDAIPDAPLLGTPRAAEYKSSGPVGSASHTHWLEHGYLTAQVMDLPPNEDADNELLRTPTAALGDGVQILEEQVGGRKRYRDPLLPTPEAKLATSGPDYARFDRLGSGGPDLVTAMAILLPTPTGPAPHDSQHSAGLIKAQRARYGPELHTVFDPATGELMPTPRASDGEKGGNQWGAYEPAIRRWETIMGPAPSPTEPNARGALRLSPRFTEWMMGQPAGWITDPAIGISSKDMLKACGNGVVTQQAVAALQDMLDCAAPVRADTGDAEQRDTNHQLATRDHPGLDCIAGLLLQTPSVADTLGGHETRGGKRSGELLLKGQVKALAAGTPPPAADPDGELPGQMSLLDLEGTA
jgi:hypothetical protein